MGTYQGMTDQVVLSKTPGSFRTVLDPRGSSKPEWLAAGSSKPERLVAWLNHPARKNVMTSSMYLSLAFLINSAAKDDRIRVVLCHGAVCHSLQAQQ